MADKKVQISLQNQDDVIKLFELAASEAKETNTSIALANVRAGIGKARMRLEELRMKYVSLRSKNGSSILEVQTFFASKPEHHQLEKKS